MSILIKGMNLPEDGCHHMVCIYSDGVVVTNGGHWIAEELPPHGRLGDLDRLHEEAIRRSEKAWGYDSCWYNSNDRVISAFDIKNAPTIIPAEPEEEETK